MNHFRGKPTYKQYIFAAAAGFLCLIFSGYGITVILETTQINMVWSVLFPFIIAIAYGSKMGVISGLLGGAWFPFFLWPDNGYANLLTFTLMIILYALVGALRLGQLHVLYRVVVLKILGGMAVFSVIMGMAYLFGHNTLLALNPPFWYSDTRTILSQEVLMGFWVKNIVGYFFTLLVAEQLLRLHVVRKILGLQTANRLKYNYVILLGALAVALGIWALFVILTHTLIAPAEGSFAIYSLAFMVLIWCGILVARILMSYQENQLEAEERLLGVFESVNVGIGITDLSGRYVQFNSWWAQSLKYNVADMRGKTNIDITHPEDVLKSKKYFDDLISGKINSYRLEKRYIKKDGEILWGDISVSAIRDEDGNILQVAGVINDITDKKAVEKALIDEKNFSNKLIESLPGIFYLYSYPDLKLILWNSIMEEMSGFTHDEMKGRYIAEWVPYEAREYLLRAVENVMQEGSATLEAPILGKNGKATPFMLNGTRLEANGQVYLMGYGVDISERIKAERNLKAIEARQAAMISNITDVIAIVDKEGYIRYKSPNISKWFGWEVDDVLHTPVWNNIYSADLERVKAFFERILREPNASDAIECRYKGKDGSHRWIEAFVTNCINYPDIQGLLINYRDISERKKALRLEQEVQVARKSAEFKQKFLANMSHEIRTPLTGVLGMTEIMSKTKLDNEQRDYLNTLLNSGENLKEIINIILDYSKIEAGQVSLKKSDFALTGLFKEMEDLFNSICHKPISWQYEIDNMVPAILRTDKQRLGQVVRNLLSNAVKFTEQGEICLKAFVLKEFVKEEMRQPGTEITIRVELTDTGAGIPAENMKKLFNPFFQIDDHYARDVDGTGLGLAISKELVSLLDGEIGVKSVVKKGSKFWFTFKAEVVSNDKDAVSIAEKFEALPHVKALNILLAEDKVINQKVIRLLLEAGGHKVTIAANGKEVLDKYNPGQFELILMDIQMPVMDGIAATHQLQKTHANVPPIIGLSANAFEGDREKYMSMGMDEYLTKPLRMNDFNTLVKKLFQASDVSS